MGTFMPRQQYEIIHSSFPDNPYDMKGNMN